MPSLELGWVRWSTNISMAVLKSEKHHWWPETVSAFWKNSDGKVNWLQPDGTERSAPPKNFGAIGNGHHIKFSPKPNQHTVWDESFEKEFDAADSNFRHVIQWLEGLPRERLDRSVRERFLPTDASDDKVALLVQGLVSLAVRSPMTREACVSLAEMHRGRIEPRERNSIIGLNMRQMHRTATKDIGTRGKFVVIFSPDREFIFGDGFYHNITSPGGAPVSPSILAPLTPRVAVLYARPMQYSRDPRFMTLVVGADEAKSLNDIVQAYAKDMIFYVNDRPEITDAFKQGKHLEYTYPNAIDRFIGLIP